MTIRNYTFFSPNGTEFPVTANSDGKLYMLLAGNDYSQFIIKHWSEPVLTGLNKIYADTSVLLGGRYFELNNEPVGLKPNSINYIHANVDPSNINTPVTLSVETANNSNSKDINSGSGVIKHIIDIVTTDATSIIKSEAPEQGRNFNTVAVNKANVATLNVSGAITQPYISTSFAIGAGVSVTAKRMGNLVTITFKGSNSVSITSGSNFPEKIPVGYRPIEAEGLDPLVVGRHIDSYYYFNPDGTIVYPGEAIPANSYFRGVRSYFTKDPFPK